LKNALEAHGGVTVQVLIDTNVGQNRTGINDLEIGVALAHKVQATPYLKLKGIQGFAGQAQHIASEPDRRHSAAAVQDHLQRFRKALEAAHLPVDCISGSGTGTSLYDYTGPYTELQVGSYIFMDADYQSIDGTREPGLGFETSLYILATVVSASIAGQVTVDAGVKALAFNGPAPKIIVGAPAGTTYRFAGDEHGILQLPDGAAQPKLGTKVLLQTTHCDPTVNLFSQYQAFHPNGRLEIWPIGGRYV
jgi:D-serine deaminase-like pyridoxal phosphate-dependent protein